LSAVVWLCGVLLNGCAAGPQVREVAVVDYEHMEQQAREQAREQALEVSRTPTPPGLEKAILAAGCFWGVEAELEKIPGVVSTTVGYTGGTELHPTYPLVCAGKTGHAEAVEVIFDPKKVSYESLLEKFFATHPATSKEMQSTHGGQYRSAIFYTSEEQKRTAERLKAAYSKPKLPIVTEISPEAEFTVAEDFHQDYLKTHNAAECH